MAFKQKKLNELIMGKTQFKAHKSDRPSRGPKDNALYHPSYGGEERGQHLGWMRSTSWYTKASTHPLTMGIALAGAAFALVAAKKSRG